MRENEESIKTHIAIPRKKQKEQGLGSRKGNEVSVTKWKHRFYKWRVRWIEEGRKQEKGFKRKDDAETWAEDKEKALLNFGVGGALTAEERSAVLDCRERLLAVNLTLRDAVTLALELKEKESRSIIVGDLVPIVIGEREKAGRSERYLQDLRSRLGRFKTEFQGRSVATLTRDEITDWLRGLKQSPTSQNNYLRVVRVMLNDAVKRKYLDESPAKHIIEAKAPQTEVGTLTPGEISVFLSKAPEELVPTIALGAFAGIRRDEIRGLNWSDVNLTHRTIRVRPKNAKSARNRIVPIEDNLADWLQPYANCEGRIWCEGGNRKFTETVRKMGFGDPGTETVEEKKEGIRFKGPYPSNGLRHSYATYWLAKFKDSGALSLNLGHTNSRIVFDHYRAPVAEKDATSYWVIRPKGAENVVEMNGKQVA
ncbi:site-specific integrase [Verrucomicrobiales bacterium]|nr:site-specific integrase [Verrucomicrobiales bacterium]